LDFEGLVLKMHCHNRLSWQKGLVSNGLVVKSLMRVKGIWVCGCSLFNRRELWASKSAGFNSTRSLKICGCKRGCLKDLRVCAPAVHIFVSNFAKQTVQSNLDCTLDFRPDQSGRKQMYHS
jgi:hypothetical protein